jgi:hypothetical protein
MRMRGHITAPLLAASQNEFSGNFFTYPDRQRFRSTLNTYSAVFSASSIGGQLQSWLSFGLIQAVMGFGPCPQEFTKLANASGGAVITTRSLHEHSDIVLLAMRLVGRQLALDYY